MHLMFNEKNKGKLYPRKVQVLFQESMLCCLGRNGREGSAKLCILRVIKYFQLALFSSIKWHCSKTWSVRGPAPALIRSRGAVGMGGGRHSIIQALLRCAAQPEAMQKGARAWPHLKCTSSGLRALQVQCMPQK